MNEEEPRAGTVAPDFTLPDQDGKNHTLSDYRGHLVFLYFYPCDDTSNCTEEACAIRDRYQEFQHFDVSVFGISPDSISSHKRFAKKYNLPFVLLSDTHKKVAASYGVITKNSIFGSGKESFMRISFLINLMGDIEKEYDHLKPTIQATSVLADLEQARG
jgi:peroxiredoxin Q/BCP